MWTSALTQFYEETLAAALADPAVTGVSERQLRTWFDHELITEAGTRGLVQQGKEETAGLPNAVIHALQRRFLVRNEARGGDTWIELVHDRFVEPIRKSNWAWFARNLNPLTQAAQAWRAAGCEPGKLYAGSQLAAAAAQLQTSPEEFGELEQDFIEQGQKAEDRRAARRQRIITWSAALLALAFLALAGWALRSRAQAQQAETYARNAQATAVVAQATAQSNAVLAQAQLDRQAGLVLLREARQLKEQRDVQGAIAKFRAAQATTTDLGVDVEAEIDDVRRQVATRLVQEGEAAAKGGNFPAAEAKFKAALALEPPPDTPVYVYVPAGEFVMGAGAEDDRIASEAGGDNADEHLQHPVTLDGYWIQRTEVTNAQYRRCVEAGGCKPLNNGNVRYWDPQFAKQPVTGITWNQARDYAAWAGGRLPTEAEWEKACRGTNGRTYPWGNQKPTGDLLNFSETGLDTWSAVGSYPDGASPYGTLDMAGNVWEWTVDRYDDKYYSDSPKENPTGPASGNERVVRGGSFDNLAYGVRCADRHNFNPGDGYDDIGFRVVVSPGF